MDLTTFSGKRRNKLRDIWSITHNTIEYLHAYLIHLLIAEHFCQ